MPDRGGGPTGPRIRVGRPSRRVRTLLMTLGVLAVLGMAFIMFAGFWTDWLWYRSVNYSSVFTTTLWTKIGLFFVFGLLMAARGRLQHLAGPPAAPAAERHVDGAAEPRPLPDGHRAVQEVAAARDHRPGRPDRRRLGVRPVADLADVGQRRALRPEGPAVPPGRLLLRLRPALVPLPARLRLRRRDPLRDRRRAHALPVRRAAGHQPGRAGHGRRDRAPVGAARHLRRRSRRSRTGSTGTASP